MNVQWIPVTERLPEPLTDVLVSWETSIGDEPTVDMAFIRPDGKWMVTGFEFCIKPTHWMPLPPPATGDSA